MNSKASYSSKELLKHKIEVARGLKKAATVIKNTKFLDVFSGEFLDGDVAMDGESIVGTLDSYEGDEEIDGSGSFLVPGFIDSHVHIESSMMTPVRFQQAVLPHGTTAVIWDPHEIANVKGSAGIRWAIESSEGLDLDVFVMVPSCVPSTSSELGFESSGAELFAQDLAEFKDHPRVIGLAEMMNFPGLLMGSDEVIDKIDMFKDMKRDGHCPGLLGKDLNAYGVAGIHSCHESTQLEEAREKMQKGLHVLIREGSCAKDAKTLLPLLNSYSSAILALCSDDRNPLDIEQEGHISFIVNMALKQGMAAEDIFRVASFAAARAYGLEDRGAVAPGYKADLIQIKPCANDGSWREGFEILNVFKGGRKVDEKALKKTADQTSLPAAKNINLAPLTVNDLKISVDQKNDVQVNVIGVIPRQIVTNSLVESLSVDQGVLRQDCERDLLKIGVFERHKGTGNKCVGFVKGFGIKSGAIATSINHDSHNVIVMGSDDELMMKAVNQLIKIDGGIVVVCADGRVEDLTLEFGGLMTSKDPSYIAARLRVLKSLATDMGCVLEEPFLALSFLALPVIPNLKITDRGLVDVAQFKIVPLLKTAPSPNND